jgi:hypothetical protein
MLCVTGLLLFLVAGCASPPHPRSALDQEMFGPATIRLHPTFTQVRNWTGGEKPDGVEATLEIDDQFGEPTRATGKVMFELYSYAGEWSTSVRGRRIGGPWIADLSTRDEQQLHWNSALRSYTFQLHDPLIAKDQYYVLTAQFDLNGPAASSQPQSRPVTTQAGRLFSQLIIPPETEGKPRVHYHAPNRTPGRG